MEFCYVCVVCGRAFSDKLARDPVDVPGICFPEDEQGLRVFDGPRRDGRVVVYQRKERNPCCETHTVKVSPDGIRFSVTDHDVTIVGVVRLPE